jgi:hypothetical protein
MLDEAFRQKLDSSGRFKIVPIPPDLREEIAAAPLTARLDHPGSLIPFEWVNVTDFVHLCLEVSFYAGDVSEDVQNGRISKGGSDSRKGQSTSSL